MKIVVDGFGGDNAPGEIVEGAILAVQKRKDIEVVLTGKADVLNKLINGRTERISVVDAQDVITNDDQPTLAIRQKKDSSLVSVVAVTDLTRKGREFMAANINPIETWLMVALIYLLFTLLASRISSYLEKRFS